jgi:hypothetical protein
MEKRSAVPSRLSSEAKSLDTSTFGTPVAEYDSSACDIASYFGRGYTLSQTLTIDITLCGVWAGEASVLAQTCPPLVSPNTWYVPSLIS